MSEGEILKANTSGLQGIRVGMAVVGMDGEDVGKVKEVKDDEFLIDRPMAHDLWAPIAAAMATEEYGDAFRRGAPMPEKVVLNVTSAHIDEQGWRHA